jgi:hypothetical protein
MVLSLSSVIMTLSGAQALRTRAPLSACLVDNGFLRLLFSGSLAPTG